MCGPVQVQKLEAAVQQANDRASAAELEAADAQRSMQAAQQAAAGAGALQEQLQRAHSTAATLQVCGNNASIAEPFLSVSSCPAHALSWYAAGAEQGMTPLSLHVSTSAAAMLQAENERTQSALFASRAQLEQVAAGTSADADETAAELQSARTQIRCSLVWALRTVQVVLWPCPAAGLHVHSWLTAVSWLPGAWCSAYCLPC